MTLSPSNHKTLFVNRKRTEWDLFAAAYHAKVQAAEGRDRLSGQLQMSVPYDKYDIEYKETALGQRLRASCRVCAAINYHLSITPKDWFDKIWFSVFPQRVKTGSKQFSKRFVVDTNRSKETSAWLSATKLPGFLACQHDFTLGISSGADGTGTLFLDLHKKIDTKKALEEIFGVMCIALDALKAVGLIEDIPLTPSAVDIQYS